MSGGSNNTRMQAGVGIPKGVNIGADAHEFSGIFDLSGLLHRTSSGSFALKASDSGEEKRKEDAKVDIEDKYILLNLQCQNMAGGIIDVFNLDRGGQMLIYKPDLPSDDE